MSETIKSHNEKIEYFNSLPKYPQKSQKWKDQRRDYLTASTISAAIGANGPSAKHELFESKSTNISKFNGNVCTHWGNKWEPVANMIYSYKNNNVKIHEFGMITNPKYPILGVSPDGITNLGENGRMLEIKCPYSRVIDGKVKKDYYHQMQEQMLVCDYTECDFLECKFVEIDNAYNTNNNKNTTNNNKNTYKGIVICYLPEFDNECSYLYSPIACTDEELKEWEDSNIKNLRTENGFYIQSTHWILDKYECQLVKRDDDWVVKYYPILEKFWKDVEEERILLNAMPIEDCTTDTKRESPKRESPKRESPKCNFSVCVILDDD